MTVILMMLDTGAVMMKCTDDQKFDRALLANCDERVYHYMEIDGSDDAIAIVVVK